MLLGGWELSGIPTFYTGTPFTVTTSSVDPAGLGLLGSSASSSRPDMICDPSANSPHSLWRLYRHRKYDLVQYRLLRSLYRRARSGPGNAGRGVVRGPGYFGWDASLMKNFRSVQGRARQAAASR